jgi:nucleotide sugar dehydrogenase
MPDDNARSSETLLSEGLTAKLPIVCVQGLGFVGAAVCIAVANARDALGRPAYGVIGVDLPTPEGLARVAALNRGMFPLPCTDERLAEGAWQSHLQGNLSATINSVAFSKADVIILNVPLDVSLASPQPSLELAPFLAAVRTIGQNMRADALVLVETTVPPGATGSIVAPSLREELERRGLPTQEFRLAHAYERVMPGADYLGSVIGVPRVYAGYDDRSADACEAFLRSVMDPGRGSLTRLPSTTASELGKVLENTYRAVTIALIDEFAGFAESAGIDLFEVIAPIRDRPSHSNIRTPGLGVGGYCLTKDPLLAPLAARELFGLDAEFPFATLAVQVNRQSVNRTVERLRALVGGSLAGRRILLLGVSYRQDVGDTRHSPSQALYEMSRTEGAVVRVHDPLVAYWHEEALVVPREMPDEAAFDVVVLAVPHHDYKTFDYVAWLGSHRPFFLDAFDVLSREQRQQLRALGCRVESVGRGAGL